MYIHQCWIVNYPDGAVTIKDHLNQEVVEKFNLNGYSSLAETNINNNYMYVYLNRNGYFNIHITIPEDEYISLKLLVIPANQQEIDIFRFNSVLDVQNIEILSSPSSQSDYVMEVKVNQAFRFKLTATYDGNQTSNIIFFLVKKNYSNSLGSYYITSKHIEYLKHGNSEIENTVILEQGIYFIGYMNLVSGSIGNINLERIVAHTEYTNDGLDVDPSPFHSQGTQVSILEGDLPDSQKSYGHTFITVGFTRIIYINLNSNHFPSASRLDYYWYSSNPNIAQVTDFGTVIGRNSSINPVMIIAVSKHNPSIVYIKEFMIQEYVGGDIEINIDVNHSLSEGNYRIDLGEQIPYNFIQEYNWTVVNINGNIEVSLDNWGVLSSTGSGVIYINGQYYLNPKVIVIIRLVLTE